jgi:very-short-patch-repair endonuclease
MDPTPAQAHLWSFLRGRRLAGCKFRRRHPCGPFVLDFFCASRRLAIELDDGGDFHVDRHRRRRQRSEFLAARGIGVLRFGADQVLAHTDAVLATIAFALGGPPS